MDNEWSVLVLRIAIEVVGQALVERAAVAWVPVEAVQAWRALERAMIRAEHVRASIL